MKLDAARALLILAPVVAMVGCSNEVEGYHLQVFVAGPLSAFENTKLSIFGRNASNPRPAGGGTVQVSLTACTTSKERFFESTSFVLRVERASGFVREEVIDRVACRLSSEPGPLEMTYVRLDDDGRIFAMFGQDPQVYTTCPKPNRQPACERADF